jgi:hypothetical protein
MPGPEDNRWTQMKSSYRLPYDPRATLSKLASGTETAAAWHDLWEELYHQGDVGEASYASVPEIVRIYRDRNELDWNTYVIVATIELARDSANNPPLPAWLEPDYNAALTELAQIGLSELRRADNKEMVRGILAALALWKSLRTYARMLIDFSEEEVCELESLATGDTE